MQKVTKWENISFIISSNYRKKILNSLQNPKTPSTISKEIKINKTHVSRGIKELISKKLIKCLTPKVKKGKIFVITDYGKYILENLSNY